MTFSRRGFFGRCFEVVAGAMLAPALLGHRKRLVFSSDGLHFRDYQGRFTSIPKDVLIARMREATARTVFMKPLEFVLWPAYLPKTGCNGASGEVRH